jgi:hypothetical protein
MMYSFTQISQYLRCPRLYRYKYLDGWVEKDTRASMIFGRCFETAVGAYFRKEDATAVFFREWDRYRESGLEFGKNESWDKMFHGGLRLLECFAQHDRVNVPYPEENLQLKLVRKLSEGNTFISYVDAIGELDGRKCIIDWKTTTTRYPEQPDGLLSLDPQLICYSWMTGIHDVALVVFVRKAIPEIQYLKASIAHEQWQEYGQVVYRAVSQIEAGEFPPHGGIRFPQSACVGCSHLGMCLGNRQLIDSKLTRKTGADALDWLEQLVD